MPPNYQNGKIYCIRSHKTDQIYIGSTTVKLCNRMTGHRGSYKCFLEGKRNYITSFKLLELGDAYIELIEAFPCNSREELSVREGYWIRKENCVNRFVAGRTKREHYENNKEEILEKQREYYEDNREELLEKQREYYEDNREKERERYRKYYENNKEEILEKQREYYENNREKAIERSRKYREDNREKERERNGGIVRCSCGLVLTYGNLSRHRKSHQHRQALLNAFNFFNHL